MVYNICKSLVNQSADLLGPILAGLLISMFGGYHTLWLDVLSFGATFLAVIWLPRLGAPVGTRTVQSVVEDLKAGFFWLVRNRTNIALSVQAMVGNFGFSAASAVLMYYLLSTLHLDPARTSLNYALIGVGGLIGSIIIIPLEKRFRRGALIPSLLGMGVIGFTLAIFSRFWLMPGIAIGIVSVCNTSWNTLAQTIRQETVPKDMLGRVLGFSRVFTRLATPLGAMVGGVLATVYSPLTAFAIAAVSKALEVVISLASPIRKL